MRGTGEIRQRTTFAQQLEKTRPQAARAAWQRGRLASRVRHAAKAQENAPAARRAGAIKHRAVRRAVQICPHGFRIENDWQHGSEMVCVCCVEDAAGLHVPRRALPQLQGEDEELTGGVAGGAAFAGPSRSCDASFSMSCAFSGDAARLTVSRGSFSWS